MELLNAISDNVLSPPILFFALGVIAGFVRSDLKIPDSISRYLSIYLMMAIGFKGGVAIANTHDLNGEVLMTITAGLAFGFLQPFLGYRLLRWTTKVDSPTAAAIAAHYGSISMVTFVTAAAFLKAHDIVYAGYIVAVLALMEAPAILSALFIAHRAAPDTLKKSPDETRMVREILTNGAILLLFGSFLIGWMTGQSGMDKMSGFLVDPFQGVLALFLLDMGLLVAANLHHLRSFTLGLALFGIYMPILGGAIGLTLSRLIGLDVGTGTLFTVLCASASYIAVPAAMRLALPAAKASIYIPLSLGITFPLNVTLGIPVYYAIAKRLLA